MLWPQSSSECASPNRRRMPRRRRREKGRQKKGRRKKRRQKKRRHKKRRHKHVVDALRGQFADSTDDMIRAALDKNGDGAVSFSELWELLQTLTLKSGHAMTEEDTRAILEDMARSGDEVLTVEELLRGIRSS